MAQIVLQESSTTNDLVLPASRDGVGSALDAMWVLSASELAGDPGDAWMNMHHVRDTGLTHPFAPPSCTNPQWQCFARAPQVVCSICAQVN